MGNSVSVSTQQIATRCTVEDPPYVPHLHRRVVTPSGVGYHAPPHRDVVRAVVSGVIQCGSEASHTGLCGVIHKRPSPNLAVGSAGRAVPVAHQPTCGQYKHNQVNTTGNRIIMTRIQNTRDDVRNLAVSVSMIQSVREAPCTITTGQGGIQLVIFRTCNSQGILIDRDL